VVVLTGSACVPSDAHLGRSGVMCDVRRHVAVRVLHGSRPGNTVGAVVAIALDLDVIDGSGLVRRVVLAGLGLWYHTPRKAACTSCRPGIPPERTHVQSPQSPGSGRMSAGIIHERCLERLTSLHAVRLGIVLSAH